MYSVHGISGPSTLFRKSSHTWDMRVDSPSLLVYCGRCGTSFSSSIEVLLPTELLAGQFSNSYYKASVLVRVHEALCLPLEDAILGGYKELKA